MELDDLKTAWAAHGTMLERSLAINERLLRELLTRKVRARLWPYVAWRAVEVALGTIVVIALISVLAAHLGEPRYAVIGAPLAGFAIVATARSLALIVRARGLDYGGPVTALQRALEELRRAEYRALKWAVLGGVLFWLPAALVLFEAITGVPALARVELAWLVANLGFGLAVVIAGQALARAYVETELSPRARRLVDALSGRALRAAAAHLAELGAFERGD